MSFYTNNILVSKSEDFAFRMLKLNEFLNNNKKNFIISTQIFKSGTSIGANIAESLGAQSDADFVAKLHVSLKESRETEFWLKLLHRADYIDDNLYLSLNNDLNEIISILVVTLKSIKGRMNT